MLLVKSWKTIDVAFSERRIFIVPVVASVFCVESCLRFISIAVSFKVFNLFACCKNLRKRKCFVTKIQSKYTNKFEYDLY